MDEQHHLGDLVAAYVLGAVTSSEETLVEGHLVVCADCWQLEAELREVEEILPALAGEREPSPQLKTRIMRQVSLEPRSLSPTPPGPVVDRGDLAADERRQPLPLIRRPVSGRRTWPAALVALAAAVVLAVVGGQLWRGSGGEPAPTLRVALAGTGAQPEVVGRLRYYAGDDRIELDVRDARPLPAGRVYELWLIRGHYRVFKGVGAFQAASDGTGHLTVHGWRAPDYTLACLTVEQSPRASRPTFPLVAYGQITV